MVCKLICSPFVSADKPHEKKLVELIIVLKLIQTFWIGLVQCTVMMWNWGWLYKLVVKLFLVTRFRITLRVNFSNVNTSACIYPPLKQNPPLKSSQNNLSNGGSSAVKTLHKPKQSYIYTHRFVKHSNEKKQKSWIYSKLFVIFWKAVCVKYSLYSSAFM
jgi:hypothetical protein